MLRIRQRSGWKIFFFWGGGVLNRLNAHLILTLLAWIKNTLLAQAVSVFTNSSSRGPALPRALVTSYAQSATRSSRCSACWPATSSATAWWRDIHVSSVVKDLTIPSTWRGIWEHTQVSQHTHSDPLLLLFILRRFKIQVWITVIGAGCEGVLLPSFCLIKKQESF